MRKILQLTAATALAFGPGAASAADKAAVLANYADIAEVRTAERVSPWGSILHAGHPFAGPLDPMDTHQLVLWLSTPTTKASGWRLTATCTWTWTETGTEQAVKVLLMFLQIS